MKRALGIFLIVAVALLGHSSTAKADIIQFFTNATSSQTAGPYDLGGYNKCSIQVTSVSGAVATATVQKRTPAKPATADSPAQAAGPWSTIITISNPGTAELGYDGPGIGEIQIILTITSGTVNGYLIRSK